MFFHRETRKGFTMIELLVVIAISGILASVVLMSIENSRMRGRDAGRKTQLTEILKAMELTLTDNNGMYPDDSNGAPESGNDLTDTTLQNQFIGSGSTRYMKQVPKEPERYFYCSSADQRSMMLAVNTENDYGGSEYCHVVRGTGAQADGFGCTSWMASNAADPCSGRF